MLAMALHRLGSIEANQQPLVETELPDPVPRQGEVVVRVSACGVCHTDLDIIEGRTPPPVLPVVLGHQIVGRVERLGDGVTAPTIGSRVGVAWINTACGSCAWCLRGLENLCPWFSATGRDSPGGYAPRLAVRADFTHPIAERLSDVLAAPLLCAGAIGYRSLTLTGIRNGDSLGLAGSGASGHLVLKLVRKRFPDTAVYVFARREAERQFALSLGASWAGDVGVAPPRPLRAIIDTTPVWRPLVEALAALEPGGRLVVNAIRKEDHDRDALLGLDWTRHLWMEKEIKSVANVTRRDVREFLALAAELELEPEVERFALGDVNRALVELKQGSIRGAKVVVMNP